MKVKGLDGRTYSWSLGSNTVTGSQTRPRSSGHLEARKLLMTIYPFDNQCEEVSVPGCSTSLAFDFVLPKRRLIVEVQGEQHRRYIQHFHVTPKGFIEQKRRDGEKREWCLLNGFTLVELQDNERDKWTDQLRNAFVSETEADGPE